MFKLHWTRIEKTQFAVNIANTSLTLKHGQGHQTLLKPEDPSQGYNHAKFEDLAYIGSEKKPTLQFLSNLKTCPVSSFSACNSFL